MTTIVFRDGILAGDTRVTAGETILPGWERKVFQLADGSLFASAGDTENGEKLLRAMRKKQPPPRIETDRSIEAIWVHPDGKLFFYESSLWMRHKVLYCAIGSGQSFALGALAMGASAIESVKIGMQFDAYSGGRVVVVKLRRQR